MNDAVDTTSLPNEDALTEAGSEHLFIHASAHRALANDAGKRILVEGDGALVKDIEGKEYIDGLAGLWLVNAGHGRQEIADAYSRQAGKLAYASSTQATSIPAIELATRLAELTPGDQATAFFCSGGSEAVESAIKIARQYHYFNSEPKRSKIVGRRGSYHGATYGAMSVSGTRPMSEPYHSPFMHGVLHASPPYCYRCDFRHSFPGCDLLCADQIEQIIKYENPKTVAAVIAEPISASGGIVIPPKGYWTRLREICDRHGVLLITDEVINGFGRTGRMFASEHWDLVGDIMTVAKGLASGYAPIGAVMCRPHVVEAFEGKNKLSHLLTYGGHAAACAAALANLEVFEREGLVANSQAMGARLKEGLEGLSHHPSVGEVRGQGLLVGLELVKDPDSKEKFADDGAELETFGEALAERGLLTRVDSVLPLSPPLCITAEQIDRMVAIIDDSLTAMETAHDLG
ncbi:MAG: aspartate aminotransferase family protein [Alphaproteobacteria bacterium]|nr:aspartate aminotransferase family protein [Alphaproteobacteria bacterium]